MKKLLLKPRRGFDGPEHVPRFWKYVNKLASPGCWLWTGDLWRGGYGKFTVENVAYAAHRLSYMWAKGKIPYRKVIRHTCDVRRCVNPAHLIWGTYQENMKDMYDRGRARGINGEVRQLREGKKNCSFYLSQEAQEKISRLAAKWDLSNSQAVELLIGAVGEHKPGGSLVAYIPTNRPA